MNKGMRKDKLIQDKRHDAYKSSEKLPEPTKCPECTALFVNGRWSWEKSPHNAHEAACPACRRIADHVPAGYVELRGMFLDDHYEEILHLARHIEEQEKAQHPLERIIEIAKEHDHTMVTTTGVHVARRIGEALSRSYKGDLAFQYAEDDQEIRVYWQR